MTPATFGAVLKGIEEAKTKGFKGDQLQVGIHTPAHCPALSCLAAIAGMQGILHACVGL